MKPAAAVLLALFLVPHCVAQRCDIRHLTVTVFDHDTQPVNLAPGNLEFTFDKRPATLVSLTPLPPGRVILLLDASGSMTDKIPWERDTVEDLLRSIAPSRPVAVITFADKLVLYADFDTPRDEAIRRIDKFLQGHGRTALLDAVAAGARKLSPIQVGDAIVLISDGGDNAGRSDSTRLKNAVSALGLRVFVLGVPDYVPSLPPEQSGENFLEEFGRETGGGSMVITDLNSKNSPSLATKAANATLAWLGTGYDAEIQLPVLPTKLKRIQLKLVNLPRGTHPTLAYSQWISPCMSVPPAAPTK